MNIFINIALLVISFIFVVWGGNKFVDSSVSIANSLKIPPAIVGATIVSIGTTLPELLVTILSSARNQSGLAIGNALGSIVFNSCIIGGLLLIFTKNKVKNSKFQPTFLFLSYILFCFMCINRNIEMWESIILIAIFFIFIIFNIKNSKNNKSTFISDTNNSKMLPILVTLIFSALLIAVGANALVNSASNLSRMIGLSETAIGLTIISFGSSLPELITSIIAILKKESTLGLGNIIGSNIINLLLLIGISGLINSPLKLSAQMLSIGVPFALIATVLLCLPLILFSSQKKWPSGLLFVAFALYYCFLTYAHIA